MSTLCFSTKRNGLCLLLSHHYTSYQDIIKPRIRTVVTEKLGDWTPTDLPFTGIDPRYQGPWILCTPNIHVHETS